VSATYEPGTVAMIEVKHDDSGPVLAFRDADRSAVGWSLAEHRRASVVWIGQEEVADVRPLVVIDPEDREQVERLAINYAAVASDRLGDEYLAWENRSAEARDRIAADLTAALREFANPTPRKPEEPTGLGAVVEDADGDLWVRVDDPAASWIKSVRDGGVRTHRCNWVALAPVSILSEGVTPC